MILPKWYDLHTHFRQDGLLAPLVEQHKSMGCAGALAMPNTRPPLTCVFAKDETAAAGSLENYLGTLRRLWPEAEAILVPLYLSAATTPAMIEAGAKSGLLRACKYYPPHGTTNAEHGANLETYIKNGVLAAMQDHGVVLCLHGENHGLSGEAYFGRATNAEESFYRDVAPNLVARFPKLKIVAEHITTKTAVAFVRQAGANVAASVTPQHLLYTVGDLLQGLKYHLYCLPVVKFEEDVAALRQAVTTADNGAFFAGTDSAPHTTKATPCGCAAGCYTGGVAPQLYAQAFEKAGIDLSKEEGQAVFKNFLCLNGARFYDLQIPQETFALTKEPQEIGSIATDSGTLTPLPLGILSRPQETTTLAWRLKS